MEEKNIIQEKDSNKTIKSILYIIIFSIAAIGIILASTGYDFEFNKYDKYYDEEYYEDDDYYDDDEDYYYDDEEDEENEEQEEPTEDETSENIEEPNQENEEQEDDLDKPIIDDKLLESKSIKMTTELRESLINITNDNINASSKLLGEIFKEEISNEIKLLFTIEAYYSLFPADGYWGCRKHIVKRETLLKYAKMLFADVEIPSDFATENHIGLTYNLTCDEENCTYFLACGGEGRTNSEIITKITHNGEVSIVRAFYGEYNWSLDDYDVIENITLYDKYKGKKLATIKNFNVDDAVLNYDTLSKYITNQNDIPTYEFKFDDQNRLVSVKRVDK